jgi:NADH-quinone oxidoreductase subunit L
MLWSLPALPVAAAIAVVALRRRPSAAVSAALGALVVAFGLAVWSAVVQPAATLRWGVGLQLTAAVTGFGRVMVVLIPLVALPVAAYAAATERAGRLRLLALMVGFVGAMELLVVAADLLTLLIAWELIGATSWALIGHGWRDRANGRAAAQAFVTTRVGDLGLYLAAGLTFAGTGTFDLAAIGDLEGATRSAVAAGILFAAAAKSAQVPFSPWLFAAMSGPTPVSALLHSATLVSAGAYLLVRVAPVLEPVGWFLPAVAAVGLTTALLGSLVALAQDHIKRVLAGSTSAQYGLMFLAVGAGSVAAAGAQLVTHALFKSLLFLSAGVAIHAAGSSNLSEMRLGRSLPAAAALAGIGALALAAVPPLGGGWSKEQIVAAGFERSPWLGAAALLVAVLTAAYAT